MDLFSVFKFFKRKQKEPAEDLDYSTIGLKSPDLGRPDDLKDMPKPPPSILDRPEQGVPQFQAQQQSQTEHAAIQDNMRAKIDLIATQVDSIRVQQESMGQRVASIEQAVRQLLAMANR